MFRSMAGVRAAAPEVERPVLELSGPRLRRALESLVRGAEPRGGVERYAGALALKTEVFRRALGHGAVAHLDADGLARLVPFMATVRRRVRPLLTGNDAGILVRALAALLDGAEDTAGADARIADFCARFPPDAAHRWVRDLAAEALHFTLHERYPLMTRWVWDAATATGVLREIWHEDEGEEAEIGVRDGFETHLVLREELSRFLSDAGFFREMPFYVDLLMAEVYAHYVSTQGGTYLRADFNQPDDPLQIVVRMLGLDGARRGPPGSRDGKRLALTGPEDGDADS